jgi:uncharacterized protein YbjT (DUF2867 family)
MRWVVFGGTGRTGGRIAAEAAAQGHAVVVVGRSARADTVPAGAEAVAGDATDPETVSRVVRGADVVAVSLSIPRAGPSPFARVTGPPDLHSRSARLILEAMATHGVQRLLKVSAQGVGPSAARAGWGFRALVAASNLGPAFADHDVADALVAASDRDWTIAHPPVLSDAPGSRTLVAGEQETTGTFTTVSRDDLARWLVAAATDPAWSRRRVTLRPG